MTVNKRKNRIEDEVVESKDIRNVASTPPMESDKTVVSSEQVVGVPPHISSELCEPMDEKEHHWHDKIERAVTRFQSTVIDTCLDAADHGATIAPYTRDRLTNSAILIYQFANNILLPRGEP